MYNVIARKQRRIILDVIITSSAPKYFMSCIKNMCMPNLYHDHTHNYAHDGSPVGTNWLCIWLSRYD